MTQIVYPRLLVSMAASLFLVAILPAAESDLQTLRHGFQAYSGAEIVFSRDDLPEGRYHDVLKPLSDSQKLIAAKVCNEEAKMYPPGFLGEVGLKTLGVFAACASKNTTDSSRPFDQQLGGYRYFGIYNGENAVAAAMYSEGQLALTFHHEIFHHVDSTVDGVTEAWQLSADDAFYQGAISGLRPHVAPPIAGEDLAELRRRCIGITLKDTVSQYAAKNPREDQAETARHAMSMLPNSLVQAIEQTDLAGSQRILHVLREYERAVPDGPDFDWFVDVALERSRRKAYPQTAEALLTVLSTYADGGVSGYDGVVGDPSGARAMLKAVVRISPADMTPEQSRDLVRLSTEITGALLRARIRPDASEKRFDVWGQEDANGVNRTLRHDIAQFANDAKRLSLTESLHQPNGRSDDSTISLVAQTQLRQLRLISRYYVFIDAIWTVTPGTQAVFESAKLTVVNSLATGDETLKRKLISKDLKELAKQIPIQGLDSLDF